MNAICGVWAQSSGFGGCGIRLLGHVVLRVSWACLGSEGSFRICRVLASKALRFRMRISSNYEIVMYPQKKQPALLLSQGRPAIYTSRLGTLDPWGEPCLDPKSMQNNRPSITQRAQYPLIKEYTVNHQGLHIMIYKLYSLIKSYWDLWVSALGQFSHAFWWFT